MYDLQELKLFLLFYAVTHRDHQKEREALESQFSSMRSRLSVGQKTVAQPSHSPSPTDFSMENEMQKAAMESKLLKSVVVPLEEVQYMYVLCDV